MYIRKKMSIFLQKKEYSKVRGEGILIKRIHNAKDHPKAIGYRLKAGIPKEPPEWMALSVLLYKELFLVGPVGLQHAEI